MRFEHKLDSFMWFLIYTLPLFAFFAFCLFLPSEYLTFGDFMAASYFDFEPISNVISSIFESLGAISVLSSGIIEYGAYFVFTWFLHILVDFLLLIPRWLHKFYDKVGE